VQQLDAPRRVAYTARMLPYQRVIARLREFFARFVYSGLVV
jgi:hypothetical protein